MVAESSLQVEPVNGKASLVDYLVAGCKPEEDWRIGTEHEKFAYHLDDLRPLEYEGSAGVRELLERLTRFGWEPVTENGNPVALSKPDGSFITLEPAGQLELSGAPVEGHSRNLRRGYGAPTASQSYRQGSRYRIYRPRLSAQATVLRYALDAEGPLQDHARIHADQRNALGST